MNVIRTRMPAADRARRLADGPAWGNVPIALFLGAVCLTIAIYGYFIYPPLKSQKPPHVLFFTDGGPVLFPHLRHSQKDGGAFDCSECHHKIDEGGEGEDVFRCRGCHYENTDVVEAACADGEAHPRCIGRRCNTCHEGEECFFCHRKRP